MSVNNINKNTPGQDKNIYAGGSKFFNEKTGTYEGLDNDQSYYFEDNLEKKSKTLFDKIIPNAADLSFKDEYYIPLDSLNIEMNEAMFQLSKIIEEIETLMSNIQIDYTLSPSLEETHRMLWGEVCKYNSITTQDIIEQIPSSEDTVYKGGSEYFDENTGQYIKVENLYPSYISFEEYMYADRSESNVARRFIKEYSRVTSHSVFSYLIDLRNLCTYILNEGYEIKNTLTTVFREEYENDTQKQVAVQFDAWAKVALHNAKRIRQIILSKPGEIPTAELDKITQKQAIEFQAFFAIRLDSVNEEIENLLENLKKEYTDNCEIFYKRYLHQALVFKKDISSPMELSFYTTSIVPSAPILSSELVIATNVINANVGMILTDMIQRSHIISAKIDSLFYFINNKRKYCNYLFQLSFKGTPKQKTVVNVKKDDYLIFFQNSEYKLKYESDLISNHASLSGLEEDHHPQYLLKSGGAITGNILVENNSTIDGVNISSHSHNGIDGSVKIKSTDIDYDTPKQDSETYVAKPLSIGVDSFISDIIDGGIPVIDLIISIESPDTDLVPEYEIIIAEVE